MNDLTNRIAVVTGASSGIGHAAARELLTRGARVVVNARRTGPLDDLLAHAKDHHGPGRAQAVPGDCADQATIDAMLDRAAEAFGRNADLVIVNAGRGLSGSVMTSDPAQWDEMIRTNLLGAARLMRAAAERMLADINARGTWLQHPHDITVIGSVVGRNVSPFSSMYGSTKFAVHGLVEGQRRELAPRGVRVSLVEPGFVVSGFQSVAGYEDDWFRSRVEALGPMLQPEDVARTIAFIAAQPPHVHAGDVVIRPTRQDYP